VFKRGKTWSYSVYLGRDPETGKKRYQQRGGFPTKRACEDALREVVGQVRTGDYTDSGGTTLAAYVERWLTAVTPTVRPTTAASYRSMVTVHVVPVLGATKLNKITGLDLSTLYATLLVSGYRKGKTVRGLSPTTVRYVHRILTHALDDAVRWGLLLRNPARQVDPPRRADSEMPTWSAAEVRAFLDSVAPHRLAAMWTLLCTTGMRRGEVLGLRWDDMDLTTGRIAVRRALVEIGGRATKISEPKTSRGRRSVSLDAYTVASLTRHRKRQAEERLALGLGGRSELVFTRSDGAPLRPQYVTRAFASLARKAGLQVIRVHDLRHTSATLALTAGVHPKIVSERLGHSTVQLTLDRYSHVAEGLQDRAAKQLGEAIFGQDRDDVAGEHSE
jgi:integrase